MSSELIEQLEGALVNSEGKDFTIRSDFVREIIKALREPEARAVRDPDCNAVTVPIPTTLHPDTADLVAKFAWRLAIKLRKAEQKYGYSNGWKSPDWMDECRAKLNEHLAKGDPIDVAAYCAFLMYHNAPTSPPVPSWMVMTDEQIVNIAAREADTLDATRVHAMRSDGWHSTTMFDGDAALIRFARALLAAAEEKGKIKGWNTRADARLSETESGGRQVDPDQRPDLTRSEETRPSLDLSSPPDPAAPSAVYEIDGKLYKLCNCDPHNGPCAKGTKRTLFTTELSRCIVPAEGVLVCR